MIELTPRSREIAKLVLESSHPVIIKKLAAALNVSQRTIRYDLDLLKEWFKERGLVLHTKPRVGVWVECSVETRKRLITELSRWSPASYVLDKHDRVHVILLTLIRNKEYVPLWKLAGQIRVSRSTAADDMRYAIAIAESCNLEIVGKPRLGYRIFGTEHNRRVLAYLLLTNLVDESKWLQLLSLALRSSTSESNTVASPIAGPANHDWFGRINVERMLCIGKIIYSELGSTLTDSRFVGLVVHLSIALERIMSGERINLHQSRLVALQKTETYAISKKIANNISRALEVDIPETEIGYITLHLLGRRTSQQKYSIPDALGDEKLLARIQMFVSTIQEELKVNLDRDENLCESLFRQLRNRRHGLFDTNPWTRQLMKEYPALFATIADAAKGFFGPLDDGEIGELCMLVQASVERRKKPKKLYRTIVACSTGTGAAELLRARLNREFPDLRIIKTTAAFNVLMEVEALGADLVISTVALPRLEVPSAIVSPLLVPAEAARIRALIYTLSSDASTGHSDSASTWALELARLLDGTQTTDERVEIIRDFFRNPSESEGESSENPDFVAREEMVRFAADLAGTLGVKTDKTTLTGLAIHLSIATQRWKLGQFSEESQDEIKQWTTECSEAVQIIHRKLSDLASVLCIAQPPIAESVAVMRYFATKPSSLKVSCRHPDN